MNLSLFSHPIDVIKTRLQVSGTHGARNYKSLGTLGTIKILAKEEGYGAFYQGIGAAWLREASYTSLRLGLYTPIKSMLNVTDSSPFLLKFISGSIAGAIGSFAGNPFDILKTRLMAVENIKGVAQTEAKVTFSSIVQEIYTTSGILGFYKGLDANIIRAMVFNGTKMACYDEIKYQVKKYNIFNIQYNLQNCINQEEIRRLNKKKELMSSFLSAFISGFFMALTVTPFDLVRTKLMNQSRIQNLANNEIVYKNFFNCFVKTLQFQGVSGLYAGFLPLWMRIAPNTVIQLMIFDQIKPLFGVYGKNKE